MKEVNTWPGWECVRQLGAGSFGKVYEIQKSEHGKLYKSALKVITIPQNDADIENVYSEGLDRNGVTEYFKSLVNKFSNEIALMSELRGYTNIVSYEDHMVIPHEDKIGWDILIKMELLTPLLEWEKGHPMQEEDVIRLGCDICRALELCHKNKIIHRDIKPQNIFVNKNGDFKLGDFGIARVAEKTSSVMSQKGTDTYMAPEVFRGQYYNESADIYSLGIVLYRCLNQNRTPFLPMGNLNFNDRQIAQERRMSGEVIPAPAGGSENLKQAVLMTLRYDPGKRIQSAAVLRNILEQCWADCDNTAPPESKEFSTTENAETSKHVDYVFEEIIDDEKTVLSEHKTTVQPKKKNKTGIILAIVIAVVAVIVVLIMIGTGTEETYPSPKPSSSTASTEKTPAATQDTTENQSIQENEEDLSKTDDSEIIASNAENHSTNIVHIYEIIAEDLSWQEAKKACEHRGGYLATITSREEYQEICSLADEAGITYLWLGANLYSDADEWQSTGWITGEPWSFENWYPGEPSKEDMDGTKEYYLCLWKAKYEGNEIGWTFNDQRNDIVEAVPSISGNLGYICEYEIEVSE